MVQSHASCHWTSPDRGAAAPRAHASRSSGRRRSRWGPRESNPAGLSGRRVYSAPRLPYRSRAPLLVVLSPPKTPKIRRATESSRWLLRASATGSTELREWEPPSGNVATLEAGRLQAVGPAGEAAAIEAEARKPGARSLVRRCFFVSEAGHCRGSRRMKDRPSQTDYFTTRRHRTSQPEIVRQSRVRN